MQLLYHPIIPLSFGFHLIVFQFSLKRGHDILTRNERRTNKCNIRYRKSWTNKKLALTYGSLNRTIIYIRRFKIFLADSTNLVSNRLSQFHYTYVNTSTDKFLTFQLYFYPRNVLCKWNFHYLPYYALLHADNFHTTSASTL